MHSNNIESLIAALADAKPGVRFEQLFYELRGKLLFLGVVYANEEQAPAISLVSLEGGVKAVLLCTSQDSRELNESWAGIKWEEALEMVLSIPAAGGVVLKGVHTAWVFLDKEKIRRLLNTPDVPDARR